MIHGRKLDKNSYVFATAMKQSLGHIRACDCLKRFTNECEPPLSNPEYVTSTKLRKYIATIPQVIGAKRHGGGLAGTTPWSRHQVHREYYRLHGSTIEIAKASKLLLAVDSGRAGCWAGKSLSHININGKLHIK